MELSVYERKVSRMLAPGPGWPQRLRSGRDAQQPRRPVRDRCRSAVGRRAGSGRPGRRRNARTVADRVPKLDSGLMFAL